MRRRGSFGRDHTRVRSCDARRHLSFPKNPSVPIRAMGQNQGIIRMQCWIAHLLGTVITNLFKSRRRLKLRTFFFGISSISH